MIIKLVPPSGMPEPLGAELEFGDNMGNLNYFPLLIGFNPLSETSCEEGMRLTLLEVIRDLTDRHLTIPAEHFMALGLAKINDGDDFLDPVTVAQSWNNQSVSTALMKAQRAVLEKGSELTILELHEYSLSVASTLYDETQDYSICHLPVEKNTFVSFYADNLACELLKQAHSLLLHLSSGYKVDWLTKAKN
ncbi:hypothetical protein VCHA53O466_50528 [Vibrio chagasii]|nr:hypothetical protein VCHA53O466_50528 [Vibrio chagasii]